MKISRLLILMLAALVTACGGGGGSDSTPPPPPVGVALPMTLAATGSFQASTPSAALSGFRLMNTLAELDQLAGPNVPPALRALNFADSSVMYVEGPADDFLGATVRLVEIRRFDGTRDQVTGERCTNDIAGIPTPSRANRPYALYVIPKLMSTTTYSGTSKVAPCATVDIVSPLIRAGIGDFNAGLGRPQPAASLAIRTQAELDALLPSFALGEVPPQYRAPDFSQVTLLFVPGAGDNDPNSYVRVDRVYINDDGSRDVIAEYCGNNLVFLENHFPFALYVVPRFTEAARLVLIERIPGACALPR